MSNVEYQIKKLMRDSRTTYVLLFALLVIVGFRIYNTYNPHNSRCDCMEGIQYAKRVPAKEGLKSTYSVESPALKAMFEKNKDMSSQFNIMKTKSVEKDHPTKTREEFNAALKNRSKEKFSSNYLPPQVMMAAKGATEANPFYGPINL